MNDYERYFPMRRHIKITHNFTMSVNSGKVGTVGDIGLLGLMILRWYKRERVFFHQMDGWYKL